MKIINDFNDFLLNNILESVNKDLPFRLSDRLRDILLNIDHPISSFLMTLHADHKLEPVTLVDYDDSDVSKFIISQSNKVYDLIMKDKEESLIDVSNIDYFVSNDKNYKPMWNKNRVSTRIGRLISKLAPDRFPVSGEAGKDIESFVDYVKAERTKDNDRFKIVDGNDIIKYYNESMYDSSYGTTLKGSCMRHKHCSDYIDFYAKNKNVRLLILMSDDPNKEGKIVGRALVWKLSDNSDLKGRYFMDRIYSNSESITVEFKSYANEHNWLYKSRQNSDEDTSIVDPVPGNGNGRRRLIVDNMRITGAFPYMDTLKFFEIDDPDNPEQDTYELSNDAEYFNKYLKLESTGGGYLYDYSWYAYADGEIYPEEELYYSDSEERYILPDTAAYNESSNEYASQEYAEANWRWSETQDKWFDPDDCVYIGFLDDYVSDSYADDHYVYVDYDSEYRDPDDCYYSNDTYEYVPKDEAIKVYTNIEDMEEWDWRDKRNEAYIKVKNTDGKIIFFDEDLEDELVDKYESSNVSDYEYDLNKKRED